jgi:hypothetical protein
MGATARRLYVLAKGDIKGRNAAKPARVHISLGHGERLLYLRSGGDSLGCQHAGEPFHHGKVVHG